MRRSVESTQYTSQQFAALANEFGIRLSVGRTGQCWDCQPLGAGSRKDWVAPAVTVTIKAMLVHAPDALRHETAGKTQITLARHLAGLRPRRLEAPEDALRHALRTL
ncbi:hypothetical protein ACFV9O_36660, partial [Streptomyces sp. NPDC059909]